MKKEKSCGCIIVDTDKVLVIKDSRGNWGFPKGHIENDETEEQTAIRETKEETNLDVELDKNRRYVNHYITDTDIDKTVIFFKANKIGGEEKPQVGEVDKIKWVDLSEVKDVFTFDNLKVLTDKFIADLNKDKASN